MIVDIHCHILPGVDDGARSVEETKAMLIKAFEEGIDVIVATPHYETGMSRERQEKVERVFQETFQMAKELYPGVQMYLGNEIYYGESTLDDLSDGIAMPVNHTKYVLTEYPIYADFEYIERSVRNLLYAGYVPILAHIERYDCLSKIEHVEELVELGAYMQVNTSSVTGKFGRGSKKYILKLMKHGLVHFLGTDAHSCRSRSPQMQACLKYIERKMGETYCRMISEENPEKMIKGEYIDGKNSVK